MLILIRKYKIGQVVSEKKKKIRSKSNEPHVTGTKSFARLADDEVTLLYVFPL